MLDRDSLQMRELAQSLARVHEPSYGLCEQCGGSIPFDRLKVEPWALRCVACESRRERGPRL